MTLQNIGEVNVRPATNEDREKVTELVSRVLEEFGMALDTSASDADLLDLEATYLKTGGLFEVVEDGRGNLVGTVGVCPRADAGTCTLRKMYVVAEARGLGLGRRLLERALAGARQRGFRTMVLETASTMSAAIRLYTRAGFRPLEQAAASPRCNQVYSLDMDTVEP